MDAANPHKAIYNNLSKNMSSPAWHPRVSAASPWRYRRRGSRTWRRARSLAPSPGWRPCPRRRGRCPRRGPALGCAGSATGCCAPGRWNPWGWWDRCAAPWRGDRRFLRGLIPKMRRVKITIDLIHLILLQINVLKKRGS